MPRIPQQFQPPTEQTKRRLIEVCFSLFVNSANETFPGYEQKTSALFDAICELTTARPTIISIMIDIAQHPRFKPTRDEMILVTRYFNLPVRKTLETLNMGNTTYYKRINSFIHKGEPAMNPRFPEDYEEDLHKFMRGVTQIFTNIGTIINLCRDLL